MNSSAVTVAAAQRLLEAGGDLDARRPGQEPPAVHQVLAIRRYLRHKMLPGSREAKAMVPAEPFACKRSGQPGPAAI